MNVLDFFDLGKAPVRIRVPGAQVAGRLNVEPELQETTSYDEEITEKEVNYDYAKEFKEQEEALCIRNNTLANTEDRILRPDSPTTCTTSAFRDLELHSEASSDIYSRFRFARDNQPDLSINSYQDEILDIVESNNVVVIQGPTGCGKTTQVPQFILDQFQAKNKYCKVVVTQPRRIAAISVAKRVSEERGWPIKTIVGYQVALDSQTSEDTLLTYMTTGVLLQKLVTAKTMNQYTHVILDEVHERDQEMDFLLLVVRRFLRTVSPHVKVILMSATFDVDHFASYFTVPNPKKPKELVNSPVIDVTKAQPYTVNVYYLEQFMAQLSGETIPAFKREEPQLCTVLIPVCVKLIEAFNRLDPQSTGINKKYGSVLIFLPGLYEIDQVFDGLQNAVSGPVKWHIVPLHSSITNEEQKKAFESPPPGYRKIILSTNIAESSITVTDVVYVIDFCLTKILECDPATNYSSLKLSWASHANCVQRAGRVGRVGSGKVYRMITSSFYNDCLNQRIEPEMTRSPLHRLVLLAKRLNLETPPKGILGLAIDPPALNNIEQTITLLKEAGALLPTCHGVYDKEDGDLTYIGNVMAQLPLDINVSKLIILGYMFSTLKECTIMAAACSLQNIFSSPFHDRLRAYTSKLSWAGCSCSDLIAYLQVYALWDTKKNNASFGSTSQERAWMRRNFLQARVMREWRCLVSELKARLGRLGLSEPVQGREAGLTVHERALMLKVVMCGAFYPNYFVRSCEGGQVDEMEAVRVLGGRDPYTTVYFSGKPANQPVQPYVHAIKDLLTECGQHIHVSHDASNKIYIKFNQTSCRDPNKSVPVVAGRIALEVYRAVKYRHLKMSTTIRCMAPDAAQKRVKEWAKIRSQQEPDNKTNYIKSILPGMDQAFIEIDIVHVNDPGHFFARNVADNDAKDALRKINEDLCHANLESVRENEIVVGQIYAAPFNGNYFRAKVVCLQNYPEFRAQVVYMDYGNSESVPCGLLRAVPGWMRAVSPLVLECVLAGVQPSLHMNPHAIWTTQAHQEFVNHTQHRTLYAHVYSVVDDIVSVELYIKPNITKYNKSINEYLVELNYAQWANESFLSQDNHKKREDVANNKCPPTAFDDSIVWIDESNEMDAPMPGECLYSMTLKGPFSPLEMQIFSVVRCGVTKSVGIEGSSVNSVLLDSDPQDPHDRLLVAANVNQSPDGTRLMLRNTTIMPNIPGYGAIMALIFCPKMELKTNAEGTQITSVLCGLGCDPNTKKSYFPAHDLALNLDFELTEGDINMINEIRYFMNTAVHAMSCYKTEIRPIMAIETCQNEIRKRVRQILKMPHKDMKREISRNGYVWGKMPNTVELLTPGYVDDIHTIWPLHSSVRLTDGTSADVRRHLEEMRDIANNTIQPSMTEITCRLCNVILYDVYEMRLHLVSELHVTNAKPFEQSD